MDTQDTTPSLPPPFPSPSPQPLNAAVFLLPPSSLHRRSIAPCEHRRAWKRRRLKPPTFRNSRSDIEGWGNPQPFLISSRTRFFLPYFQFEPDGQLFVKMVEDTRPASRKMVESFLNMFFPSGLRPTPAQATAVSWVLKDGMAHVGKLICSNLGARMDSEPKCWRILADVLYDFGTGLEIISPLCPQLFLEGWGNLVKLFEEMPDLRYYNSRLYGMMAEKRFSGSVELVKELEEKGLKPNAHTYYLFIKTFVNEGDVEEVKKWFAALEQSDDGPTIFTYILLVPFASEKIGGFGVRLVNLSKKKKIHKDLRVVNIVPREEEDDDDDGINALAAYQWWEGSVHSILCVLTYPFAWSWQQWRRRMKLQNIRDFVRTEYDHACLCSCRSRALYEVLKVAAELGHVSLVYHDGEPGDEQHSRKVGIYPKDESSNKTYTGQIQRSAEGNLRQRIYGGILDFNSLKVLKEKRDLFFVLSLLIHNTKPIGHQDLVGLVVSIMLLGELPLMCLVINPETYS